MTKKHNKGHKKINRTICRGEKKNEKDQRVKYVVDLYKDSSLYSTLDMFSPPAERLSHVIRFELTRGCGYGRCTYCSGYEGMKHEIKTLEEYGDHVNKVFERIGKNSDLARHLRRTFIGGGNALEVGTGMLDKVFYYTNKIFKENTGRYPERMSVYGRTKDILDKKEDMKYIERWLDLIYWGVESGSSEVLDYVNKGCTMEEIIKAAEVINRTNIKTSVMIMPGLGGKKYYNEHIKYTAKVLGKIKPRFITFMGINSKESSRYSKIMKLEQENGINRPLTDEELVIQMKEIIKRMPVFKTSVGCFEDKIDKVGHNPVTFDSTHIRDNYDKRYLLEDLDREIIYLRKKDY